MPLVQTKGAGSAQGVGQFARRAEGAYIEDVFSTWLYTGNGSTQTITNGIDLSTKGGLLWIKGRSANSSHWLVDTARGNTKGLYTDGTVGEQTSTGGSDVSGFSSSGFSLGTNQQALVNTNGGTFASWTFRKQAKFFDVVTYTGDGNSTKTVNHNLGSVPGCILIKATVADSGQSNGNWIVLHRSIPNNFLMLNSTSAQNVQSGATTGTSTTFNAISGLCNGNGITYVAYLFAHDAGGFGAAGTDSVIKCGTWLGDGSVEEVNLGWEPQFILYKSTSAAGNWFIRDNMRGWGVDITATAAPNIFPNLSSAESSGGGPVITSTGFRANLGIAPGYNYVYIAIRRGPMRTPTSGTSVFSPSTYTLPSAPLTVTTGFPIDLSLSASTNTTSGKTFILTLTQTGFSTNQAATEFSLSNLLFNNTGLVDSGWWATGTVSPVYWNFRRAPGFVDVVCYSGTGSTLTINHNLQVNPEMVIVKRRNSATYAWVYHSSFLPLSNSYAIALYSNQERFTSTPAEWISALSTNQLTLSGSNSDTNAAGGTYMASLFASCPGVSKVGSYTGTGVGVAQTIDCGFTTGARFVLIKRSVGGNGDWYVYDSARGISASNDPFIFLNTTAAQNTSTDYISPQSSGFGLTATAPVGLNAGGSTYIYLAIA